MKAASIGKFRRPNARHSHWTQSLPAAAALQQEERGEERAARIPPTTWAAQ